MRILAIEKESPGVADDQFTDSLLESEAARAWVLYQEGVIRDMYFRDDREEAVLLLECKDVVEASRVLRSLPLVDHGLISFELIPLRAYPGFSRLFKTSGRKER